MATGSNPSKPCDRISKEQAELLVLHETIRGMVAARDLQAREYERRLEELNHAHQQAVQKERNFVPRETFESILREWQVWRAGVDREMSEVRGSKAGVMAMFALVLAFIAAIVAVANILFRVGEIT